MDKVFLWHDPLCCNFHCGRSLSSIFSMHYRKMKKNRLFFLLLYWKMLNMAQHDSLDKLEWFAWARLEIFIH